MALKEKIISSLEKNVAEIKAEEQRQISIVKEQITREKIVPFNQEIDQARIKAEAELQQKLTANITSLQQKFTKEKQALLEAGELKKKQYAESVITSATYHISSECEKIISELTAQINKIKE